MGASHPVSLRLGGESLACLRDHVLSGDGFDELVATWGRKSTVTHATALRFVERCEAELRTMPHARTLAQWILAQPGDQVDFHALLLRVIEPLVAAQQLSLTDSGIAHIERRMPSVMAAARERHLSVDWRTACTAQPATGHLPRDVLGVVFAHTRGTHDIAMCARTCKQWYCAAVSILERLQAPQLVVRRFEAGWCKLTAAVRQGAKHWGMTSPRGRRITPLFVSSILA